MNPRRVTIRVAVSGASGLIGGRLAASLASRGDRVDRLVRRAPAPGRTDIRWEPVAGTIDEAALEGVDVVVHLAGESVAAGRWTAARKEAIRRSRVDGTRLLAESLARLRQPPSVFLSASGVGYYGDRGDEVVTEDSAGGDDFLAGVCRVWEAATDPARRAGIRVVNLRIGMVLSAEGGALARMLVPFRLGLGGVVGSGRQYVSWIALADLVGAIHHLMLAEGVSGPVNAVAPRPVSNRELTKTLGRVLRRPTLAPLPAPLVRLLFGEMGQALLLASARVLPARLQASGFRFAHPELEAALRHELSLSGGWSS